MYYERILYFFWCSNAGSVCTLRIVSVDLIVPGHSLSLQKKVGCSVFLLLLLLLLLLRPFPNEFILTIVSIILKFWNMVDINVKLSKRVLNSKVESCQLALPKPPNCVRAILSKEVRVQRSGIDTIKYHTWPRIPMGKWQTHSKTPQTRAKRSALSQQVTTRHI